MNALAQPSARRIRPAPAADIAFGQPCNFRGEPDQTRRPVVWRNANALNGHMLLAGGSGSGKTHQLRRIIAQAAGQGIRAHVIDVHGDIALDDAHTVRFSESTTFGLNPLEVSADPDFGGPRNRTLAFAATLTRLTQLGARQKIALIRLIMDVFRAYGFNHDDPRTWTLDFDPRDWAKTKKRYPTISDLKDHTLKKLRSMKFGMSSSCTSAFEALAREIRKHQKMRVDVARGAADPSAIATLRDKCIDAFAKGLERMETGTELDDMIAWDSADAVKGLFDRIDALEACGVFRGTRPDFPAGAQIHRYDISALRRDDQQLFVDTMLSDVFFRAKQAGEASGVTQFVVLDEAAIFIDEDPDHIINVVVREARKFGLGVILASQSLTHMTEDLVASAGTKFILGVDEMFHQKMESRLALPKGKLRFIRPKATALVQVKSSGDMSNKFEEICIQP